MRYSKKKLRLSAYLDICEYLYGKNPKITKDENGFEFIDGLQMKSQEIAGKLAELRAEIAAKMTPVELRYVGDGKWTGPAPIPGMYYACERDEDGAWWRLHGPYATGEEAEAAAAALDYGAAGGWVVVYSDEARAAADRGERPIA